MKKHAATLTQVGRPNSKNARTWILSCLRKSSGSYNDLALLFGSLLALAWLCYVIYAPTEFNETWWADRVCCSTSSAERVSPKFPGGGICRCRRFKPPSW